MPPMDDDLSLEEELGAALDGQTAPAQQEPTREAKKTADAAFPKSDEMPARPEYVRDGRRFIKKDADGKEIKEDSAATADSAAADAAKAAKDGEPKVETPTKQWKPLWYKDEYGPWDKLAEPFRAALREQERNASQAIEKHSTAAKAWDPVNQLLAPHAQELAAAGVTQQQYVSNLVNADKYLRTNPVEALNWLCQQYLKTDVIGLADWMAQNGQEPAQIDPMKQELDALKARLSNYEQQGQNAQRAALETQIQDWAKDKPHFEDVRELMASLARVPQNKGASLDQLYESAMLAHPQLRQRILEDKRRDEVTKARAAGATSPRSTPVTNGSARTKPTMSLEEEIGQLYDGGAV